MIFKKNYSVVLGEMSVSYGSFVCDQQVAQSNCLRSNQLMQFINRSPFSIYNYSEFNISIHQNVAFNVVTTYDFGT